MKRLVLWTLVALLGATASPTSPLLVTSRYQLVYVDGDGRRVASAGPATTGYRLLSAMADGSVLVAFDDAGFVDVESVSPSLASRTIKTFPRAAAAFIAPSSDGFLVYDASTQLLRRYDAQGSLSGTPAAPLGARTGLGIGDTVVVLGPGRLDGYDRRGRLQHAIPLDGAGLAALPGGRFAVSDPRDSEIRVYTTVFAQTAALRVSGRPMRALAAGPDGSVGILTGTPACGLVSDVEVDVFDDPAAAGAPVRLRANLPNPVNLTITSDAVYVANAGCRGDDGSIAVFGRDGTPRGTIVNVGSPSGVLPLVR
jgi:hypothetical protein